MNFEDALKQQLDSRPKTLGTRRLLRIYDLPKSNRRRKRIMARMERAAAGAIGHEGDLVGFDWSSVDWEKVFDIVLKVLLAILPFLL